MHSKWVGAASGHLAKVLLCHHVVLLLRSLNQLPGGQNSAPEVPNLQPTYVGGQPKPGDTGFTIKLWQLQLQRWLLSSAGGLALMDQLGANSLASWQFFNVTVEGYQLNDCFAAAVVQVSSTAQRRCCSTTCPGVHPC
jgi:hypothetical protein